MAIITGIIDGLTRFKTLATPLLRVKIIFSFIILALSIIMFFVAPNENNYILTIILSILSLGAGFQLGLWGKKLINVILPGTYPQKKGQQESKSSRQKQNETIKITLLVILTLTAISCTSQEYTSITINADTGKIQNGWWYWCIVACNKRGQH